MTTLRFSLLSKSVVIAKLLHLENLVCNGSGVDQLFFSYECNEFMTIGTYKVIQVTE